MAESRERPPASGEAGASDPPNQGTEVVGSTRPGYSSADTDPFARTELVGSKPPLDIRTPVGTPVLPLADTNVDPAHEVHPGAIDAAAREAERRDRQIDGLRQGTLIGRFTV